MIDFFTSTYIGAFLCILIGALALIHSIKKGDVAPNSPLQPYISGIVGGLIFILVGIIVIVNKILGNW